MHPLCEAPGCEEEARGRVSVFAEGWTGGFYVSLCVPHLFSIINVWPMVMKGIVGKPEAK